MRSARELADGIAAALAGIPDCRVWGFAADTVLPPAVVVERPTITWAGAERTFDEAEWAWPLTVVAARGRDRDAHDDLDRIVGEVETRLGDDPTLGGITRWAQLVGAVPVTATINGQDLPGYEITLRMIA